MLVVAGAAAGVAAGATAVGAVGTFIYYLRRRVDRLTTVYGWPKFVLLSRLVVPLIKVKRNKG